MRVYRETIQKIHHLSDGMLNFCKASEWDKMLIAEQERQVFLSTLADNQATEFDEVSEKLLQEIISINAEIENLSRQEMNECQ